MNRSLHIAFLFAWALSLGVFSAPVSAQLADLALSLQLVPDEPLDAGSQADIVLTVENRGPDASGRFYIGGATHVTTSGFDGRVLFRLTSASTEPCPLRFLPGGDPPSGGAFFSSVFIELTSIPSGQRRSCRIRIEVMNPLPTPTVANFVLVRFIESTPDPNPFNNLASLAVGSSGPRVIPAGGPVVLTLLAVLLGALGARSVRRRGRAGAQ